MSGPAGKDFKTAVGGARNLISSGTAFCISGKPDPGEYLTRSQSVHKMQTQPSTGKMGVRPMTANNEARMVKNYQLESHFGASLIKNKLPVSNFKAERKSLKSPTSTQVNIQ